MRFLKDKRLDNGDIIHFISIKYKQKRKGREKMRYNKSISTLEILEKYPFNAYYMGIDSLSLENINKKLVNHGFTIETLDADYVHVYDNYVIILVKFNSEIHIFAFTENDHASDEEIQRRRDFFFNECIKPLQ